MKIHIIRKLKSIISDKHGGASVAIAIMMGMVLAISFVQNILIWGQLLTSEERDRLNEEIQIEELGFINNQNLEIVTENIGSVSVKLVAIFIEPYDPEDIREITRYSIEVFLNIGETKNLILEASEMDPEWIPTDEFVVTLITERGTSVSRIYSYQSALIYSREVGEMGVFRTNWFYSKYTSLEYPPFPNGNPSKTAIFISKEESFVAFYVEIKNIWVYPCRILRDSFLALTSLQTTGSDQPNLFLVRSLDYFTSVDPKIEIYHHEVDPIEIQPGDSVVLIFAADDVGVDDWAWGSGHFPSSWGSVSKTEGSGIMVSLFYKILEQNGEETLHGQTIATQAVILRGA